MENHNLRKGPVVISPNCSNGKPEPLPKMRRRCKSETLDAHHVNKRPPFFNGDKFSTLNTNNEIHTYLQKNSNSNENNTKSPNKFYNQYVTSKPNAQTYASDVYYNKNFFYKDNPKLSSTCNSYDNSIYNVEPRNLCNAYDKNNYSIKQQGVDKQAFINYHPKLFQDNSSFKLDAKRKEETYRQFCHDVDALRGQLNHLKNSDTQHRNLENYIKRSIIQANLYKEKDDKLNENSSFNSNVSQLKHYSLASDNIIFKTGVRSDKIKEKSTCNYGQNHSPSKHHTDKAFNFQTLAAFKGTQDLNTLSANCTGDDLFQKSVMRRRIRARSESDSNSQIQAERCREICNTAMTKRTRDVSPKPNHSPRSNNTFIRTPKKDSFIKSEIDCNTALQGMADDILKDLQYACKTQNKKDENIELAEVLTSSVIKKSSVNKSDLSANKLMKSPKSQRSNIKTTKITSSPTPTAVSTVLDDEPECGMETSDGLDSDSEADCSDSDNQETSYTLDNLNNQCTVEAVQDAALTGCPFTPSLFPNVPPSICFADHSSKVATMPLNVYRILKWKLTNITPIVVRKTLLNSGFRLLRNTNDWMGTWGKHMKSPCFRTLRSHQKINHFPGTFQIGRKDRLWRNMHKCIMKFGKREFGFIPRTFVLPQDLKLLRQSWEHYSQLEEKWIIKPPASARGTGIRVVQRWSQIPKRKPTVVQKYIARPLLINGSKFDLRLYVLVTSMHPLRIYLYPEGLARFASVKYSDDPTYLSDRYMHLTNYSINKLSTTYKTNEDAQACDGHKWTLSSLWKYLSEQGINVQGLWKTLSDLVIRTIVCGESTIQVLSRLNMASRYNCYELFGIDVLLDAELKPWLLEVNISPSLHSASPLDLHVKGPLVKALFNTALYKIPPKLSEPEQQRILQEFNLEGPLCYDKRLYCTSLSRQEKEKHLEFTALEKRSVYLYTILEHLTPDDVRHLIQAEDELVHCAPLERIFPTSTTHSYLQYFESPRYYNRLFDAWEHRYGKKRSEGITLLKRLCADNVHLEVPLHSTMSNFSGAGGCRAPSPLLVRWERCYRQGLQQRIALRASVNRPRVLPIRHRKFRIKKLLTTDWPKMTRPKNVRLRQKQDC